MVGQGAELATVTTAAPPRAARADLRALGRGSSLNFVGAVIAGASGVGTTVLVARTQTPAASGVFFVVTSLFVILAGVSRMGSGVGTVYFVAQLRALGRADLLRGCVRTATRPAAVVASLVGLLLLLTAGPLGHLLAAERAHEVARGLRLVALVLPFAVLLDIVLGATRGFGTMRPTFMIEKTVRPLLQLGLVAAACFYWHDLLPLAWTLPWVPALLLAGARLRVLTNRADRWSAQTVAEAPADDSPLRASNFSPRVYWRFCTPRAVTGVLQTALLRMDVLLVAAMSGPGQAAIYTSATRFLIVGQLVTQSVSMAVGPQLSGLLATRAREQANILYRMSTAWLILATWPVYLSCAAFAPLIMSIFGADYASGSSVIVVLSLTMLLAIACGLTDVLLTMAGKASWNLYNRGLALAVNVAVDLVLIPRIGIMGAAVGWACAIVVSNVVPVVQLRRSLDLSPWGRATGRAMLVSGIGFGLVPLAVRMSLGDSPFALLTGLALGIVVYAGIAWAFREALQLGELTASLRSRRRPAHLA